MKLSILHLPLILWILIVALLATFLLGRHQGISIEDGYDLIVSRCENGVVTRTDLPGEDQQLYCIVQPTYDMTKEYPTAKWKTVSCVVGDSSTSFSCSP